MRFCWVCWLTECETKIQDREIGPTTSGTRLYLIRRRMEQPKRLCTTLAGPYVRQRFAGCFPSSIDSAVQTHSPP